MKWFIIYFFLICFCFNYSLSFGISLLFNRHINNTMVDAMKMNTNDKMSKKTKCLNPPRTAKKVEINIKNCQEEVKNKIIKEAFEILRDQFEHEHELEDLHKNTDQIFDEYHKDHSMEDHGIEDHIHNVEEFDSISSITEDDNYNHFNDYQSNHDHHDHHGHSIKKRSFSYHPTLVRNEDKRIAGCLLHCIYAKNNAVDKLGWPTLDGLVDFYSEGVNEHGFFMATLRAVNLCLKAATYKYHVNRHRLPEKGESCDLAFDVFDCISDQITVYCLDNYNHE